MLNDARALVEKLVVKGAKIDRQPRHPADVQTTWADIGKAREILSWQPEVRFEEGVERLVVWYQEIHGWARRIETR